MICDLKRQAGGGGDPQTPQLQNDSLKQSHCYSAAQLMTYSDELPVLFPPHGRNRRLHFITACWEFPSVGCDLDPCLRPLSLSLSPLCVRGRFQARGERGAGTGADRLGLSALSAALCVALRLHCVALPGPATGHTSPLCSWTKPAN